MIKGRLFRILIVGAMLVGALPVADSALQAREAGDSPGAPGSWTQWRGPNRDGIAREKIRSNWSEVPPGEIWRRDMGSGFSGITVAGKRLYTMYSDGTNEYLASLEAATGREIWRTPTDKHYAESVGGDGPRATPLLDDGMLYTISAYGKLYALNPQNGKVVWQQDLVAKFGAQMPRWGFSMTPIVDGDMLLTDVGGKTGYSVMAFHKKSGEVIWHSQTDIPGYSSPMVVPAGGVRQALFFTGTRLVSVNPDNGEKYWAFPWITRYDVNAATPVFVPPDRVFISSDYGKGGALLQIKTENGRVTAAPLWQNREMKNHMATCIYRDGYLYGFDDARLKCIDAATGETRWQKQGFGKGTVLMTDDHLIVLGERGQLALVKTTPEAYTEIADLGQVLTGRCWTVPTLVNGRLYLRSLKEMVCLDFHAAQMND